MIEAPRGPSLRGQFRWRLALLQGAILSLIVTALTAILIAQGALNPIEPGDDVIAVVREAATRTVTGDLALRPTPALSALRSGAPGLWFSLRDQAGHRLSEGTIPPEFAKIGAALDGIGQARLGWNIGDTPRPTARMQWVDTRVGTLQVITGPGASPPWYRTIGAGLFAALVFLLPILAIMMAATWLATPIVVRAALRGLDGVIVEAGRIDIDRRGVRLPVAAVPREVRPLVDAVNATLGRLDEGYARHRRFLADAAHELRTPIAILMTRLGLLPPGGDRARLIEDAGRLATLAEQMLDLERLRPHGRKTMRPIDLVALARDVAADLAPMAIDAGYALAVETIADRTDVIADRASIERALINLVQNAIQHGGRRGTILLRVDTDGSIEVHDEGPGIADADKARIFAPFHRLGSGTNGAGLGLHLVGEVVALHGGRVVALDSPLGGLCMRMELPIPESRKVAAIQPA